MSIKIEVIHKQLSNTPHIRTKILTIMLRIGQSLYILKEKVLGDWDENETSSNL
ncbi:hypothetical protein [Pontibacillus yanchengensis]|uniref:hypothetical protein n=1 Tax=Pontibacillus yanchengensis TaxID=462910 RepID=UPI001F2D0838|nr:hypothetical protein [Pontibacillus yanchengensis]